MRVLFGSEMKALEASADRRGVGYQVMMEQAGNAAADWIAGQLAPVRCTVLCGTGNNGGDGYFAAKRLREAGVSVTLAPILGGPKTELAQHAREQAEQAGVPIVGPADAPDCCRSADVVLDALFGIGFHGEIPESARRLARELEQHPCVVALDLPSGLGADSPAEPPVSIAARHTLCLGAAKPACLMLPARQRCGAVHILSTGIPDEAWQDITPGGQTMSEAEAVALLPARDPLAHKGSFGRLLSVCGSSAYTGAAALSAMAALRAGVGIVTVAATRAASAVVGASVLEATFLPLSATAGGNIAHSNRNKILLKAQESDALLVGCGLGRCSDVDRLVQDLIVHAPCRLILDADALNALEGAPEWLTRAAMTPIITPHVGEMSRLTGRSVQEIKQHAPKLARDFAREYRCVVVLKDASTVIASPEGRMFYHPGGNAGLARGGSGDLLAGMVASFAAQGMEAATAAAAAVTLHGASAARCAGRRSMTGMLPHDLLEDLCTVFVENGR